MDNLSSEIVGIIYQLLPGFITACLFYLLTCYPRPDPFERVIQALIFTVITKAIVIIIKAISIKMSAFVEIGTWTKNVDFVITILFAIILGILFSWCVNNDFPLWLFRKDGLDKSKGVLNSIVSLLVKLNLTNKALHPTEWYSFFKNSEHYVILHLDGERRLMGYLMQFPNSPNEGHFIVIDASWINDDNSETILQNVDRLLISAKEVIRVEILK